MAEPKRRTVYKSKYTGKVYNTAREAAIDNRNFLTAQRLAEQTKRIPATYIGGDANKARATFWKQEPVMQHAVDSIANRYGIDSSALKYRLDKEGFVDGQIKVRNNPDFESYRGYDLLHTNNTISGVEHFGLDDVATLIEQGKVKPINENWWDVDFTNEKGRQTHGAQGTTVADNIGLMAATLKYFTDEAKKDNPNLSNYDANRYGLAYYNRGVSGGKKWATSGAKGYDYRRSLEDGGIKPITTSGAGYVPNSEAVLKGVKKAVLDYVFGNNAKQTIRRRLYDNISPYSYANALNRVHNAVVKNKREYNDYKDSQRDDIFAEYLGIPKNERHKTNSNYWKLNTSKYKPSVGSSNTKYFSINLPKEVINDLYNDIYFGANVRNSNGLGLNENVVSETIDPLGRHTIGRGYDSKGEYMSYYDKWDLTPYGFKLNDQSFGIGNPVNIYDRIYLDDYYRVSEPTHTTYLPEVVVYGRNKKASGGSIHIAPSKRGTLTAAATKHGMSAMAFAHKVMANKDNYSSKMVKKANFAINFNK